MKKNDDKNLKKILTQYLHALWENISLIRNITIKEIFREYWRWCIRCVSSNKRQIKNWTEENSVDAQPFPIRFIDYLNVEMETRVENFIFSFGISFIFLFLFFFACCLAFILKGRKTLDSTHVQIVVCMWHCEFPTSSPITSMTMAK